MQRLRVIGLMSGTSMDGVDVALVETDGEADLVFGPTGFFPYSEEDRVLLRAAIEDASDASDRKARPGRLAKAEACVTERHGEALEGFMAREGLARASIDLVGFHGQTVLHRPERGLTMQIGDGEALARRLGMRVVYDFRAADVSGGGQGAPLVPIFHKALVLRAGLTLPVVILNIGGVANLTFIAAEADPIACDTGPGNALLDDLMRERTGSPLDRDGGTAARGRIDPAALEALLAHPYFDLPPPKSLDRNAFSRAAVARLSLEDAAATLTAFTAAAIARSLAYLPTAPRLAIVSGGGARNLTLLQHLRDRLACEVIEADRLGWSADAMEAQAFAYLAARHLRNLPITFPATTGIARPLQGGVLAAGSAA